MKMHELLQSASPLAIFASNIDHMMPELLFELPGYPV